MQKNYNTSNELKSYQSDLLPTTFPALGPRRVVTIEGKKNNQIQRYHQDQAVIVYRKSNAQQKKNEMINQSKKQMAYFLPKRNIKQKRQHLIIPNKLQFKQEIDRSAEDLKLKIIQQNHSYPHKSLLGYYDGYFKNNYLPQKQTNNKKNIDSFGVFKHNIFQQLQNKNNDLNTMHPLLSDHLIKINQPFKKQFQKNDKKNLTLLNQSTTQYQSKRTLKSNSQTNNSLCNTSKNKNNNILRQINQIKERFNLHRLIELNTSLEREGQSPLPNAINIKSFEPIVFQTNININPMRNSSVMPFGKKKTQTQTRQSNNLRVSPQELLNSQDDPIIHYYSHFKSRQIKQKKIIKMQTKQYHRNKKFVIPFQTYFYRDLIWKINYTNSLFIQTPIQYEHRLKAFIGKGNNSCLVRGLINRRYWFAITDKIQEANFVWTQLKQMNYFRQQVAKAQDKNLLQASYERFSLLNSKDIKIIEAYHEKFKNVEQNIDQRFIPRMKHFHFEKIIRANEIKQQKMQNHLINNYVIGNKKALFKTMLSFYKGEVFKFLPLTFHIQQGLEDQIYFQFLKHYYKRQKDINNNPKNSRKQYNAWIVKPGQNSNRGNGIRVCLNLQEIKSILKKRQKYLDGTYKTFIVQAYIEKPLLYNRRKFDLRHYIMITCVNGFIKGYWYKHGYVRTTSSEYTLGKNDGRIHLTNDAIQKNLPDYGKFEKGNKISYDELNQYILSLGRKVGFFDHIYPKMKKIATDVMKASSGAIDPEHLQNNFELFGLDFMIDFNLDPWLIEVNSNPCLELSCPLLGCIIPKMLQNLLELTLDANFPPPVRYAPKGVHYFKQLQKQNCFQLVYDQRVQGLQIGSLSMIDIKMQQEQDDVFEDDGEEWEQD